MSIEKNKDGMNLRPEALCDFGLGRFVRSKEGIAVFQWYSRDKTQDVHFEVLKGLDWDFLQVLTSLLKAKPRVDQLIGDLARAFPDIEEESIRKVLLQLGAKGFISVGRLGDSTLSGTESFHHEIPLPSSPVAVLGAGVIGASVVRTLARLGFRKIRWLHPTINADLYAPALGLRSSLAESGERDAPGSIVAALLEMNPSLDIEYETPQFHKKEELERFLSMNGESKFLVYSDDYLPGLLRFWVNQVCRQMEIPWVFGRCEGTSVEVGPLFRPDQGPCYECYASRLSETYYEVRKYVDAIVSSVDMPPKEVNTSTLLGNWLGQVAADFVYGRSTTLQPGMLHVFDYSESTYQKKILLKIPLCSVCGKKEATLFRDKSEMAIPDGVIELQERTVTHTENGYRVLAPEKIEELASPFMGKLGIIGELFLSSQEDSLGFPVSWVRSKGMWYHSAEEVQSLVGHAGKAHHVNQAIASGICEAAERYVASSQGDEPVLLASYSEVSDMAVPADRFCRSESYPDQPVEWAIGFSLTQKRNVLVPTNLAFLRYRSRSKEAAKKPWMVGGDSNGLACGGYWEDAILQGLLEVVERDQTALLSGCGVGIRPVTFKNDINSALRDMFQKIRSAGADYKVFYSLSDLPFCNFVAAVFDAFSGNAGRSVITYGAGCHLDPNVALSRAVTEAIQMRATMQPKLKEYDKSYKYFIEVAKNVLEMNSAQSVSFSDIKNLSSGSLLEDVCRCVELLDKAGYEVIIVPFERAEFPLKVVRVMIPGLIPGSNAGGRLVGCQRLYDLAARLGLADSLSSEDLMLECDFVNGDDFSEVQARRFTEIMKRMK